MARHSSEGARAALQRLIQTRLWGMDIHPSARIARTALIDRTWPRGVHIAEGVFIDEQAVLLTHDFTRGLYQHTRVGARTVIGARAVIMPGITIGEDCEIAPGALVTKDMPSYARAIGNPAVISDRERTPAVSGGS